MNETVSEIPLVKPKIFRVTPTKKTHLKKKSKNPAANERFKILRLDPEFERKRREALANSTVKMGRPPGNPDGMSKSTYIKARKVALKRKEKVLAAMAREDKFIPDNDIAAKALDTAVEILLLPGANSMRMSAAKVLLEFTQRKPATASQVTLNAAEDFLDSIAPQ